MEGEEIGGPDGSYFVATACMTRTCLRVDVGQDAGQDDNPKPDHREEGWHI